MDSSIKNCKCREPLNELSLDLTSMLETGYFADVIIKCGSVEIQAHKNILSARSSVLKAMLTNLEKQETQNDTVVIDDVDPSIITILITYIYSGQIKELPLSSVSGLLHAAEKYQVKGLKKVCVQYLEFILSTKNALEILHYADLHDEELKARVKSFICMNISHLKNTEDWDAMQTNHPALAFEVYSYIVDTFVKKYRLPPGGDWSNTNFTVKDCVY